MPVHDVKSKAEFGQLAENGLTAVCWYAPWCGSCKQFLPAYEEISQRFSNVRFLTANADELKDLASDLGVQGLPFFIVLREGQKVQGFGHLSKSSVEEALRRHGGASVTSAPAAAPSAAKASKEAAVGEELAGSGAPTDAPGTVRDVQTGDEFNAIIGTGEYCVVDFYAPWCGACKNFMPDYEAIAQANGSTARFLKVNVDELEDVAGDMDVSGLPFIAFIKGGKKIDGFGHLTKQGVQDALAKNASIEAPKTGKVQDTGVSSFEVIDPKSNNVLAFRIEDGMIAYTVAGDPRPSFKQAQSDGHSRLMFPDIKKGCALPEKDLHVHLGNFKALLNKVGGEAINFPDEVPIAE